MELRKDTALLLCCVVLVATVDAISRPSTMVLENNQFKNVVIAIHDSVAEDKSLIDTLKDTMTQASEYLFKATRQRAYFREINILLPASWSDDASYGSPTKESLQLADVVITNPTRRKRSLPQTRSYSGCGKQGVHVLLTKQFLTDESVDPYTNNSAKYFIHAFAQFRWGVFQEYSEDGESEFYFSPYYGRPDAIKCNQNLKGLIVRSDLPGLVICYPQNSIDPHTNLYLSTCKWRPYPVRQRAKTSIMDHQYIQAIETFCDDDAANYLTVHNYEAPSKHNRLCGHRSTWDIITHTDDFSNNKNPPLSTIGASQLNPTFNVIKARSRKRRAVVAVETPLLTDTTVVTHIQRFLHYLKEENTEVGLVHYGSVGERIQPVINLNTLDEIPSFQNLDTENQTPEINVTDGVVNAMQTLDTDSLVKGGSIILITRLSSQFTESTEKLVSQIRKDGVDMQVIKLGDYEYPNVSSYFSDFHGSHHPGTTMYDHLSSIHNAMSMEHQQYILVLCEDVQINNKTDSYEGKFSLDPSLGVDMKVIFHISRVDSQQEANLPLPRISLKTPNGDTFDQYSRNCAFDATLGVVRYHFPTAEPGLWKYSISRDSGSYNISVTVKSKHSPYSKDDPILVRHHVEANDAERRIELYCDVTRGNHPVIGLNITATVLKHGGSVETVQLLDNGAGADLSKDDGIYSRYLTKLVKGTYHVAFKVIGENGKAWSKEEHLDVQDTYNDETIPKRRISKRQVSGDIERQIYSGSFHLQDDLHDVTKDIIPPSRVKDLKVMKILPFRNSIVLTWTATGDDLDSGQVATYRLYIGKDLKDVRKVLAYAQRGLHHENIVVETLPAGKPAGETEVYLWKMGDISTVTSFTFAIQAIDRVGNTAEVSNIATTGFTKNL